MISTPYTQTKSVERAARLRVETERLKATASTVAGKVCPAKFPVERGATMPQRVQVGAVAAAAFASDTRATVNAVEGVAGAKPAAICPKKQLKVATEATAAFVDQSGRM